MNLAIQLGKSTLMVGASVVIHLTGLLILLRLIDPDDVTNTLPGRRTAGILRVTGAALGLFMLHAAEIWAYALCYIALGAMHRFDDALYFSTATYVAIGYGDLLLDRGWRVTGAIEGANGVILLGWSTAFLVSVVGRLRILERRWMHPDHASNAGIAAPLAAVASVR